MSKPETTTAPPQLEKCPFCDQQPELPHPGETEYEDVNYDEDGWIRWHYVLCSNINCSAQGPWCKTPEEAMARWNRRPAEAALREEVERLKAERDQWRDAIPSKCPFTGRGFFMLIEHPELGWVPTYSSDPYDSYTIPRRDGANEEFYSYHYDHDEGGWADEVIGHGYRCDEPPTDD